MRYQPLPQPDRRPLCRSVSGPQVVGQREQEQPRADVEECPTLDHDGLPMMPGVAGAVAPALGPACREDSTPEAGYRYFTFRPPSVSCAEGTGPLENMLPEYVQTSP